MIFYLIAHAWCAIIFAGGFAQFEYHVDKFYLINRKDWKFNLAFGIFLGILGGPLSLFCGIFLCNRYKYGFSWRVPSIPPAEPIKRLNFLTDGHRKDYEWSEAHVKSSPAYMKVVYKNLCE